MGALTRFLGGSPLNVLLKLIVVSFIVGIIMSALGIDAFDIYDRVLEFAEQLWAMGFDAFDLVLRYFLLGAAIVIPVWLVLRILNFGRRG